jgi:hypothetical protein
LVEVFIKLLVPFFIVQLFFLVIDVHHVLPHVELIKSSVYSILGTVVLLLLGTLIVSLVQTELVKTEVDSLGFFVFVDSTHTKTVVSHLFFIGSSSQNTLSTSYRMVKILQLVLGPSAWQRRVLLVATMASYYINTQIKATIDLFIASTLHSFVGLLGSL